ncbi:MULTISPECIES: hypothetical protein [Pseudoalteromonas]|uniref:hypothetical protein n=1 Tax=Pseudoalteromonas TaxID=53246 RepID=UPI0007320450|nr:MULTISPECIES: hypothetical protein [Pseudoalteromonas]KTF17333.1 hypothetical protein ATS74_01075 [Pseudoalteromonas sp. H103]MCQ8889242.1 hypothetical protein [Pseudoalteromonas carrageenovora]MDO6462713.1 hypothetical protein [Pseudoalteromonas carrageenovora]
MLATLALPTLINSILIKSVIDFFYLSKFTKKAFLSSPAMPMIIVFSAALSCRLGFYDNNVGRVVLSY